MNREPTHPGLVFLEDYMKPMGYSYRNIAQLLMLNHAYVYKLINKKYPWKAKIALRIAKLTKTSPEFWLNLQMQLDLYKARKNEH